MREELVQLILERLAPEAARLRSEFEASRAAVGVRYCVIDDLLPADLAQRISTAFPPVEKMRLMDTFRERKYTTKKFEQFDPLMADITFAFQDTRVVAAVESITGIQQQIPDASLYAGGLSAMTQGHFLGPHIDNSHDGDRQNYRTLNLLYYVTPGWQGDSGGHLELWNEDVTRNEVIESRFNRLALMETTPTSWHSVCEVRADGVRRCVSNYYFSPKSPTGVDYFNITAFSARPEQKVLRAVAWADGKLRSAVRRVVPGGLGRKDVYEGPPR
jgi:Rps23 Pro-64 3,4-dihydroxylase Tpa1-like proline 4-hydroxylase